MVALEPGHAFDELARLREQQACAMCGGRFPGPGVGRRGKRYCCDRCAERGERRLRMLLAEAGKYLALAAVAAGIGFLVGQRWRHE